jgi:chaperonin cofactor prefoldin
MKKPVEKSRKESIVELKERLEFLELTLQVRRLERKLKEETVDYAATTTSGDVRFFRI